jgi:hypothetical protein
MPRLYNLKHETFAQAVAADVSLIDAYEHAGFVRRRGNPNRLARLPKVAARIVELQSHVFPADLANLEYIQAKVLAIGAQVLDAAGNRDVAACIANDLRRIATALDQHAGVIEVLPRPALMVAPPSNPDHAGGHLASPKGAEFDDLVADCSPGRLPAIMGIPGSRIEASRT